ncbi:TPA: hypothetical protein ACGRS7_000126 [Proteus mirabilis]
MEFKHSPAPWYLRGGVIKNSLLIDDNHNVVASFLTEIKEEDVNLIAAAPELLEALIEIRKLVAHHDKADFAIAKALGQQ